MISELEFMSHIDDADLKSLICGDELPGMVFMLAWGDLDESSPGYDMLADALFDHEAADDPDEAPARDFDAPLVRQQILKCVLQHDDVRSAVEEAISMFADGDSSEC